jgi:hypothetical protein
LRNHSFPMVFNLTMSYRRLVIQLCAIVSLTALAGGLFCAFAAIPGPANAPAPTPTVEAPAPSPESVPETALEEPDEPKNSVPAAGTVPDEPVPAGSHGDDASGGEAAGPESPYRAIIVRNAFGLKTPPPAPPPPEAPAPQLTPSALKLTGIVTFLGGRRATFVLQEPGKPQINSDLVREGETDVAITNLEVLQIDERAGLVRVAYGGKELTLDFVNNGLKPPTAPPPAAGAPGAPGAPGGMAGRAGVVQSGMVPGVPGAVAGAHPGMVAPGVQTGVPSVSPTGSSTAAPGTSGSSGLRSIPVRPTRLNSGASTAVGADTVGNAMEAVQVTQPPEQQYLIMRTQEEASRRQGLSFPPSPPIPGQSSSSVGGPPPLPGQ